MKLAIVGSGIAGLTTARLLARRHDISVFEAGPQIGGHTHTIEVEQDGERQAVDTGFIVFNDRTYPNFNRLLEQLGVAWQPTAMSFSVSDPASGLEYGGSDLNGLFAQRRNLLRPAFWRLLADILRFNRRLRGALPPDIAGLTLGEHLAHGRYGRDLARQYVIPMTAAIWSAGHSAARAMPLDFFAEFFRNHGLLDLRDRPQWRVIRGGSREYLKPLTAPFADRIHLRTPVVRVRRLTDGVELHTADGGQTRFDGVILACHSDQALRMLVDPSDAERAILGAMPYQRNETVLHTDARLLPASRRAWACWNYRLGEPDQPAALTYNMNLLQGLRSAHTWCVTLNQTADIDPARIHRTLVYHHPVFSRAGVAARQDRHLINGQRHTWYCGAYWGNGFHEDGVNSALAVADQFGEAL